jgi:hypothetical protein
MASRLLAALNATVGLEGEARVRFDDETWQAIQAIAHRRVKAFKS